MGITNKKCVSANTPHELIRFAFSGEAGEKQPQYRISRHRRGKGVQRKEAKDYCLFLLSNPWRSWRGFPLVVSLRDAFYRNGRLSCRGGSAGDRDGSANGHYGSSNDRDGSASDRDGSANGGDISASGGDGSDNGGDGRASGGDVNSNGHDTSPSDRDGGASDRGIGSNNHDGSSNGGSGRINCRGRSANGDDVSANDRFNCQAFFSSLIPFSLTSVSNDWGLFNKLCRLEKNYLCSVERNGLRLCPEAT